MARNRLSEMSIPSGSVFVRLNTSSPFLAKGLFFQMTQIKPYVLPAVFPTAGHVVKSE